MWTPVIMLLLGGFTIAAALSKYNIAKIMATFVLSKAGTKPRTVLLTNMFVAMFASMWISNVAAPVLCFSIIQPILRNLSADSDMTKALLLGIALSSNIGGAASPIASPQNLIALQNMDPEPSWGVWFFVALPVCILSILAIWVLLLVTFHPGRNTTIVPIRPLKEKFTGTQWFISIVTMGTIILWCVSHQLEPIFGDMGVIAILPIVLFFGTGILNKEDFNNFLWTIIILAAGGLSLGKAVNSSGLLHTIAKSITASVEGMSLYGVLCVFAGLILVVATFISHTVAALIVLPLVKEVGNNMEKPHPNLLVMGSVLMASAAMGLPTSGFPNMSEFLCPFPADVVSGGWHETMLMEYSGDHDGRPAHGTTLPRRQALPHQRCTGESDNIRRRYHGGVWVDACGGVLVAPPLSLESNHLDFPPAAVA
jgi:phosphate transporter